MATAEATIPPTTTGSVADAAPATPASTTPASKFQQGEVLSENVKRKLRVRQEEFGRAFGARLSSYLRMDFGVTVARLRALSFQKFFEQTVTPTHVALFKAEPARGIGLLEIQPPLGLSIVDRQLGGTGQVKHPERALTELETTLLNQIAQVLLAEWCAQWRDLQPLEPALLGHEIDVRFLNTLPRDAMMLEFAFETTMGGASQQFRIGFPYNSLEPLLRRMGESARATAASPATPAPGASRWNPQFDDVSVTLSARCDGVELTARRVATLKVGDMLTVDPRRLQAVHLHLGNNTKFLGVLGRSDGHWAVQLTQKTEN
ncbi:MAG TPA: flagellar motor switch protein FliM [Verrucomicrobiae bacterium]|nr:flagellar motor switch protein FliM [Verrucomicrobiae bacterium]